MWGFIKNPSNEFGSITSSNPNFLMSNLNCLGTPKDTKGLSSLNSRWNLFFFNIPNFNICSSNQHLSWRSRFGTNELPLLDSIFSTDLTHFWGFATIWRDYQRLQMNKPSLIIPILEQVLSLNLIVSPKSTTDRQRSIETPKMRS